MYSRGYPCTDLGRVMTMMIRTNRRKKLPTSAFAYPKQRKYPVDTPARACNALARAVQSKTSGSNPTVAKLVRRRYGNSIASVGKSKGVVSRAGYRKVRRRRS